MPYEDVIDEPPAAYGGTGGTPIGGSSAPGGSYGALFSPARRYGLSEILAQRRRRLMGLPGAAPVGAGMAVGGADFAAPAASGAPAGTGVQTPSIPLSPTGGPGFGMNRNRTLSSVGGGGNSDAMYAALAQKLGMDAAGRQAQAGTAARYFAGDDPAAAGFASLSATLGGQDSFAKAMNALRVAITSGDYEYAHQVMNQLLGAQIARAGRPNDNSLVQTLGGLGGAAILAAA